jgi:hypothetical protein
MPSSTKSPGIFVPTSSRIVVEIAADGNEGQILCGVAG